MSSLFERLVTGRDSAEGDVLPAYEDVAIVAPAPVPFTGEGVGAASPFFVVLVDHVALLTTQLVMHSHSLRYEALAMNMCLCTSYE